jgi:UDP-N-acetyl-D-galactosamine dehydrogenase
MKKIAIIGLGYVGLPLAVAFGEKREVVGFDINAKRISELNNGEDGFHSRSISRGIGGSLAFVVHRFAG